MFYTIIKGTQYSSPRTPKFLLRKINGNVWFVDYDYELDNGDQADWNKICGISFNPLKPDDNAIMIAARWNPEFGKVEVAPYFNVNGERIYAEKLGIQPLRVSQSVLPINLVSFELSYNGIKMWDNVGNSIVVSAPDNLKTRYLTSFRIQPYFGGNRTSPNNLLLNLTM